MNLLISFSGTGRIPDQLVILDMKHGVEAKNYEEVCPALTASSNVLCYEASVTQSGQLAVLCPEGFCFLSSHVTTSYNLIDTKSCVNSLEQ